MGCLPGENDTVNRVPRRALLWRLLILLPLPYLALVGFAGSGIRLLENRPLAHPDPGGALVFAALALVTGLAFAALMWSRDRGVRMAGYVGYAFVLTLAFGVGGVVALVSAVGGAHGEKPGPLWFTILLGGGAIASILSLVPLAAVIVADWSAPSHD